MIRRLPHAAMMISRHAVTPCSMPLIRYFRCHAAAFRFDAFSFRRSDFTMFRFAADAAAIAYAALRHCFSPPLITIFFHFCRRFVHQRTSQR